jgi:uncharacterized protein
VQVGGTDHGDPNARAVAIPLEDHGASRSGWPRTDIVFAAAVAVITLQAADSIAGRPPAEPLLIRLADSVATLGFGWLVIMAFRRSGRAVRSLVALSVGTAATVAGLGYTAGHIWKLGLEWSRVPGIASLLAGFVLLGIGAAVALRGARGWRKLLALPIAIAMVFYVFAPLTIAVFLTHVPATTLGGWTPADRGLAYRDVTLTTTDGVRLAGWYVPSHNGAAMVVMHGSGSTRLNVLDHVETLADAGYGVLAIDARGHGQSDGIAMDLGWMADRDFEAGVSFLARQNDVDPGRIGVLGLSMGAIGALTAAAEDTRIEAVIAEGTSVHSYGDAATLGWDGWWHLPFYWTTVAAMDAMSAAEPSMSVEDSIERIGERPLLLISGRGRDEGILNRKYAAMGSGNTELLQFPDTKHSQGIWFHTQRWREGVLSFLDRALLDA